MVAAAQRPPGPAAAVAPQPGWVGFAPLRVARVVAETDAVTSIYLASATEQPLPAARPGQYLTVRLPIGDHPVIRTYSLSSAPGADLYRLSVKREDHGLGSTYLTTSVQAGQTLDVATPRGDFVLADDETPVVLISAGIGVTPVLAMLQRLVEVKATQSVWWISAARTPTQHPLAAEAHELLSRLPHQHERNFYSAIAPDSASTIDVPGRLTAAALADLALPTDAIVYLCGPPQFMTDLQSALAGLGFAPAQVRTENFGARSAINPGVVAGVSRTPHPPLTPGDGPQVTFSRSGLTVAYDTTQRSLLEMAELCDVPTRFA